MASTGGGGEAPQANFTHSVVFKGLAFNCEEAGNDKLCAMLFAGAQMSVLDIYVHGFPGGGVEFHPFCDFVDIRLSATGIAGNEFGGIYAPYLSNSVLDLSLVAINPDASKTHPHSMAGIMPGMELANCGDLIITNVLFEQTPFGCFLNDCYAIQFINASGGLIANGPHTANTTEARPFQAIGGTNHFYQGHFRNFDLLLREQSAFTGGMITVPNNISLTEGILDFKAGTTQYCGMDVKDLRPTNHITYTRPAGGDIFQYIMEHATTPPNTRMLHGHYGFSVSNPEFRLVLANEDGSDPYYSFGIGRYMPGGRNFAVYCPSVFHEEAYFVKPILGTVKNVVYHSDPVLSQIAPDSTVPWHNTSTNELRMWSNVGGVLRKSAPLT